MQQVSKIACNNNGGYVMKFRVKGSDGFKSDWTDKYNVNQSKTLDLRKLAIPAGTEVWPEVDAVWGNSKNAWEHVIYKPDTENVATYRAYGGARNIHVDLLD